MYGVLRHVWSGESNSCYFVATVTVVFLGTLFDRVELINPVSNVRPSVRTSARQQKISSISTKFGMYA